MMSKKLTFWVRVMVIPFGVERAKSPVLVVGREVIVADPLGSGVDASILRALRLDRLLGGGVAALEIGELAGVGGEVHA